MALAPAGPFRGQIGRGADHCPGPGQLGRAGRVRDAEIGDLDVAVPRDQQVGRLDVPVHQAGRVRGGQSRGHLGQHVHRVGRVERPAVQQPGQRRASHELHDQERRAGRLGLAVVVDLGDARVGQRPGVPRLGPEPLHRLGLARVAIAQPLDRDGPAQHQVSGPPYLTDRACRDPALQLVTAGQRDPRSGHSGHRLPLRNVTNRSTTQNASPAEADTGRGPRRPPAPR